VALVLVEIHWIKSAGQVGEIKRVAGGATLSKNDPSHWVKN
jgi:hypothetical protein